MTEDGKPFFWLGDTGWLLFAKLNREKAGTGRFIRVSGARVLFNTEPSEEETQRNTKGLWLFSVLKSPRKHLPHNVIYHSSFIN